MKTYFCLTLFFLFSARLLSQEIVFQDNFDNNDANWQFASTINTTAIVSNGFYNISLMKDKSYWCCYKSIFIDPSKDFKIETNIKQTNGTKTDGYGLMWGTKDLSNFFCFLVSSDGKYRIYETNKDKITEIIESTKSKLIKPMGTLNKLSIEKKGDKLFFYLNDKELNTCRFKQFKGLFLGFQVNNRMSIAVDDFILKQDQLPINLIPNWKTGNKPENLGNNVNSVYSDLLPIISSDGLNLWLTRDGDPGNIGGQDIWHSKFENGIWQKAEKLSRPLNNEQNNFVFAVSPDNNSLYVSSVYNSQGESVKKGFSISHKSSDNWTIPEEMKIKNYYNNNKYASAFLSSNQKTILLSIERDDTYGNQDIYVSFSTNDGTWTEPKNIGNTVNTFGEEVTPFLAADDVTLYYSSSGRRGYGSNDIFLTHRLDSTWTNWSEPQNLGPEINTLGWDAYYTLPASAEYAYFTSSHNSIGYEDIFRIKLPKSAKPKPVVLIYGKVLNSKTNVPIEANIAYFDIQNSKEMGIARSDPQNGNYKIVLPSGTNYSMNATKEKFISISENMDLLDSLTEYREVEKNLMMMPIEVGNIARLNNVFFDYNKWEIKEDSKWELNRLVKILNDNPTVNIEIAGHTDNKGDSNYNLQLSINRAKAVGDYVIVNGIDKSRIVTNGYGKTKPVASNDTEEGRMENRRVEFVIIKK